MPESDPPAALGPASPCTGRCRLDAPQRHCLGCGRSLAEIAAWPTATAAARQAILLALAGRRKPGGG
ncbi:DUF1289 domain-containing protein [Paeniroseomonas aquatica]|uniref:DUF1289 domain-containing protein n=1 Tax=Paeniroseomonas aquatica TaxID=373043 RepID=A0ABT8A8K2_9PROT|nr:DUF1289 domain-containing protein [Paeniroseomonas aquatica]MDN3565968.1 DUF1289 domain-containing protein [Paeniroseomonas aquatica]